MSKKVKCKSGNFKTDYEILRENFKFIWDEKDNKEVESKSQMKEWEKNFAKKYYDLLYKEYGIADLTFYKKGRIGLRWCNETDILNKKGLVFCGNSTCQFKGKLKSFEKGEVKNALVKVNLCEECGSKINYKFLKRKTVQKVKDS